MQRAQQLASLALVFSLAAPLHAYAGFGRHSSADRSSERQRPTSPSPTPRYEPPVDPSAGFELGASAPLPYERERPGTPYFEPTAQGEGTPAASSGVRFVFRTDGTRAHSANQPELPAVIS